MTSFHQPTPGPYTVQLNTDGCDDVVEIISTVGKRDTVAAMHFWNDFDPARNGEREATAKLLAAAPELRDALTRLTTAAETFFGYRPVDDELAKAIATARMILRHIECRRPLKERSFLIPTTL